MVEDKEEGLLRRTPIIGEMIIEAERRGEERGGERGERRGEERGERRGSDAARSRASSRRSRSCSAGSSPGGSGGDRRPKKSARSSSEPARSARARSRMLLDLRSRRAGALARGAASHVVNSAGGWLSARVIAAIRPW